ncbi:hypothetical protein K491DRAFT_196927 [Lophiostoma macrostomum CBS 122681]|uniref:Uncharacterized protein n=1 Tax=Lophiostoma macrostomum CBS 122681 TaxID=1314788 RepID=A0A6A6TKK4_9PLEO|nr:hypothetical protein K491DRAFT_196927 [Lophiostoma macrostomum CBS 122681]
MSVKRRGRSTSSIKALEALATGRGFEEISGTHDGGDAKKQNAQLRHPGPCCNASCNQWVSRSCIRTFRRGVALSISVRSIPRVSLQVNTLTDVRSWDITLAGLCEELCSKVKEEQFPIDVITGRYFLEVPKYDHQRGARLVTLRIYAALGDASCCVSAWKKRPPHKKRHSD